MPCPVPVKGLAPAPRPRPSGRFRGGGAAGPATLASVGQAMMSAAMSMQGADVLPTVRQVAACEQARSQFQEVMNRWTALQGSVGSRNP